MIKCFTGPMFSDKSAYLVEIYEQLWNKDISIAFKPEIDSRDGDSIKSKKYPDKTIPAQFVKTTDDILKYIIEGNYKTVLIDEAQFLSGNARDLVDLSVILDIDFYIAGLNMTSEQEPFGFMQDILAVSDETIHVHGYCQDCNKPSYYSYSLSSDKVGQIKVGDEYISLCPNCLKRRILQKRGKKLMLRSVEYK